MPPNDPPELVRGELVHVERHPAERLASIAVVGSVCCSSCCCCCCCVHSIGGVVGAAVGGAQASKATGGDAEAARGALVATVTYWYGFGVVGALVVLLGALAGQVWGTLLAVVIAAPFFQLLVAPIALLVAAVQPQPRRAGAMRAVRNIVLGTLAGAFAGGMLMVGLGVVGSIIAGLL